MEYVLGSISHIWSPDKRQKARHSLICLFSPSSFSSSVSRELVASGELVCSGLSLSDLSAVSMPNPDVTGNWAPQIRKAGTLLWCCKQLGQAEPLPLAVCCRVQKERERKQERKRQERSGLIPLDVPKIIWLFLDSQTGITQTSSGAELSLSAWIESGGAFISAGGANNPAITWPVQKELQQAGGYSVSGGARAAMALCHWMLFPLLFVRQLPLVNENQAAGDYVLSIGAIRRK